MQFAPRHTASKRNKMHLPKANSPEGKRMDCSRLDIPGESLERMLLDGPLRDVENNVYECTYETNFGHTYSSLQIN